MANEKVLGTIENVGLCDHRVTSEYRIFGPPGTGKTTHLARQVERAVEKYGTDRVLITSFSRAAAAELVIRDLPVSSDRVGTLHSHCWRVLGGPKIAEAHVHDWNRENPHLKLTAVGTRSKIDGEAPVEDDDDQNKAGDLLLQRLNRRRGQMLDRRYWPAEIRAFSAKWESYKNAGGLLDFPDLIERCLRDVTIAPGSPEVIFVDEAQDLNATQMTLIRKWGEGASYFILAGDDDQTVYSFAGATPEAMLDPDIPDDHKIILKQSYRVPGAVRDFAESLIQSVSRRQSKIYLPRPAAGEVHRVPGGYNSPEYAILATASEHLARGKTVMFLASCSYMLRPLIQVLRKNAIPFHNPYRRSNGFWNPLRIGNDSSAASRIAALFAGQLNSSPEGRRLWTNGELALWAEWLTPRLLKKDAIQRLRSSDPRRKVTMEWVTEILEASAIASLMPALAGNSRGLLDWWRSRVIADVYHRIQFPADVVARRGPRTLNETPRVIVGTIHSVKGGEADVVYLFPDLSRAADVNYQIVGGPRDSVVRVFYVGATRARETLYLCERETAQSVHI